PVAASDLFFRDAARRLFRLTLDEGVRWLSTTRAVRTFLWRARNHFPPRAGGLLALWIEYLLTERWELVSRLLEGVREPFLADTAPLRERLVAEFGGVRVPSRGIRLAINTVDAHTGRVVRYVTAPTPFTRSPDYLIVDAITLDMVLASASIPLLFPPVRIGPPLLRVRAQGMLQRRVLPLLRASRVGGHAGRRTPRGHRLARRGAARRRARRAHRESRGVLSGSPRRPRGPCRGNGRRGRLPRRSARWLRGDGQEAARRPRDAGIEERFEAAGHRLRVSERGLLADSLPGPRALLRDRAPPQARRAGAPVPDRA